jgi:hypothetical protein
MNNYELMVFLTEFLLFCESFWEKKFNVKGVWLMQICWFYKMKIFQKQELVWTHIKYIYCSDKFQWRWILIKDGLSRAKIGSHSIFSYHVPSHNMLKWIILNQNLLYNYLEWHIYIMTFSMVATSWISYF